MPPKKRSRTLRSSTLKKIKIDTKITNSSPPPLFADSPYSVSLSTSTCSSPIADCYSPLSAKKSVKNGDDGNASDEINSAFWPYLEEIICLGPILQPAKHSLPFHESWMPCADTPLDVNSSPFQSALLSDQFADAFEEDDSLQLSDLLNSKNGKFDCTVAYSAQLPSLADFISMSGHNGIEKNPFYDENSDQEIDVEYITSEDELSACEPPIARRLFIAKPSRF